MTVFGMVWTIVLFFIDELSSNFIEDRFSPALEFLIRSLELLGILLDASGD